MVGGSRDLSFGGSRDFFGCDADSIGGLRSEGEGFESIGGV